MTLPYLPPAPHSLQAAAATLQQIPAVNAVIDGGDVRRLCIAPSRSIPRR